MAAYLVVLMKEIKALFSVLIESGDWIWVSLVIAAPFVVFGAIELVSRNKARRERAIATRNKAAPRKR